MSETSGPGGRRAGQGRRSEYQAEGAGKRQADLRMQKALEKLTDDQIEEFVDALYASAIGGGKEAPAAQRLLLEHLKGRAATQAPVQADTTINVIAVDIPRPGSAQWRALYDDLCSKCKPKLMVRRKDPNGS